MRPPSATCRPRVSLLSCPKHIRATTEEFQLTMIAAEDYAPFNAVWNQPEGGLHAYLVRFLSSSDITFQHIAVWVS